ncbi:MAG: hypothetical protein L0H70_07045 [Xanthomonadales bacterium]|nr:hypothetical protein [Xanthomonadales bacterium]
MSKTIQGRMHRPLALAVAVALGMGSAHAANITVTAGGDAGSGATCTLRQAIESANSDAVVGGCLAGSGADSIDFDGSLTSATMILASGQLEVDGILTINGSGQTIDANGGSRVLFVDSSAKLTASSLTLTRGTPNSSGGGIYVHGDSNTFGSLSLSSVVVTGNTAVASSGGGIFLGAYAPMTMVSSTISGNSSSNSGAGIYVWGYSNVDIADSTISVNVCGDSGGGLYAYHSSLTLTGSTISNNASSDGGGISLLSQTAAPITGSTISNNTSGYSGGGIFLKDQAAAVITDSTISNNTSAGSGNGPYAAGGGGLYLGDLSTATITGSTLSGNSAADNGGGIFAYAASISMLSSTLSDNSAAYYGGGVHLAGVRDGGSNTLTLRDTTVSGNQATYGGGISAQTKYDFDYSGATMTLIPSSNTISFVNATVTGNSASNVGGGVALFANNYVENTAGLKAGSSLTTLDFVSSTVSGNQSGTSAGGVYAKIQPGSLGASISITAANTIFSANTTNGAFDDLELANGATFGAQGSLLGLALQPSNSGNGNIFNDAPGLGALANNGGATLTMTLLTGSPAIDAGDNSLVPAALSKDQRGPGVARIENGTIDIGAVELVAAVVAPPIATSTVPVPVRSPWALGLLGMLLVGLGLGAEQRRRRRS